MKPGATEGGVGGDMFRTDSLPHSLVPCCKDAGGRQHRPGCRGLELVDLPVPGGCWRRRREKGGGSVRFRPFLPSGSGGGGRGGMKSACNLI